MFRDDFLTDFCLNVHYDDDVCVGAIIGNILQVPLTENFLFHSTLDQPIPKNLSYSTNLKDQVSCGFVINSKTNDNNKQKLFWVWATSLSQYVKVLKKFVKKYFIQ